MSPSSLPFHTNRTTFLLYLPKPYFRGITKVSFLLAEKGFNSQWFYPNKDTKAEVSIGFTNDKRSDGAVINFFTNPDEIEHYY
tara:strand:+ start:218 stop:466 length:249 start_codon:yes stop_codon:yes gene_type:complete